MINMLSPGYMRAVDEVYVIFHNLLLIMKYRGGNSEFWSPNWLKANLKDCVFMVVTSLFIIRRVIPKQLLGSYHGPETIIRYVCILLYERVNMKDNIY